MERSIDDIMASRGSSASSDRSSIAAAVAYLTEPLPAARIDPDPELEFEFAYNFVGRSRDLDTYI
jgi:hypothetical protein